jgi:hypothetical protein
VAVTPPPNIATDVEGWLTAVGTALLGGSTAAAILFTWRQFQRSGFTYSVRVIAGRPPTSLLVTIANKGRLDGHVSAVRVLKRPHVRTHIKNIIIRRSFSRAIPSRAMPHSAGAFAETIAEPTDLRELTKDLKPGATLTFRVDPQPSQPQETFKSTWLFVRFGDGRVVKKRPKILHLSIVPVTEGQHTRGSEASKVGEKPRETENVASENLGWLDRILRALYTYERHSSAPKEPS